MKKSLKYLSFLILLLIVGIGVAWSEMTNPSFGEVHEIVPSEDGGVDTRLPDGCDKSATTTDCSKIVYIPPVPEVIKAEEPPLLDTALNDEHLTIDNTLVPVQFCGQTYQARQVLIDGVNVVERIGEIMLEADKNDPESNWCPKEYEESVVYDVNYLEFNIYNFLVENSSFSPEKIGYGQKIYGISIKGSSFDILPSINEIYGVSGFDGSPFGPVGKLK